MFVCRKTLKTNFLKICACVLKVFLLTNFVKKFYFYYKKHNGSIQLVEIYKLKVIKTAAFCHNRALQDLYLDSYRLLFTTGSFTLTASPLSNEPDVQRVQRTEHEGRIETYSCLWSISLQERALELHYSRIEYLFSRLSIEHIIYEVPYEK